MLRCPPTVGANHNERVSREEMAAVSTTVFGSINDHRKGSIEIVSGDPKHYVFSNIFEVASKSPPYERVVVGKNLEYVQEVMRAEGVSPWFGCAHDEFDRSEERRVGKEC